MQPTMLHRFLPCFAALLMAMSFCPFASAQQARPLIAARVDEGQRTSLKTGVPIELKHAKDLGAAPKDKPAGRLMLFLNRPAEQETALQAFLKGAHSPSSPQFHRWLARGEFGSRFGAADSDIEQVSAWLQTHGLTVSKVASGKSTLEFTGTVAQVEEAFKTEIHAFDVAGVTHYANASDPSIPAALAPLVAGVTQLNDFHPTPQNKVLGQTTFNPATHRGQPQWTYTGTGGNPTVYYLTPEDFATQYDAKSLYASGVNGAGQTIGILNESNIDVSLVNAYRKLFGLPVNPPQIVIDGSDPGITGTAIEAYLDVENAGAIAPAATVKLYIAGSYGLISGGLNFSIARAIDDDAASVLSLSFGTCEENGTANNQFINSAWEQAAAQGQTVMVSTGDSGAYGCYGLGVNGFASTPWDIGVGGTDAYFDDYATGGASIANYWNNANDPNLGSLQKPFTEQPWNGSMYGLNSTLYDPASKGSGVGGGGGASACAVGTGVPDPVTGLPACTAGYPKPSWQVGKGVPSDKVRDLPDVSLFASNAYNGVIWPVCAQPGDCTPGLAGGTQSFVTGVGGTSASAPAMAAVMALVNQKYGPQGQANFTLYPLAAQFPAVINPVDIGSNNEPCQSYQLGNTIGCAADPDKSGNLSLQHYSAIPGYDLASGLGTVDVAALVANWGSIETKSTTTSLTLSATSITHGQSVTANVAVIGTGTPAGSVALTTNAAIQDYKGLADIALGANSTGSAPINYLPGGTYAVTAQYSGDGINGTSSSQPVTVTVAPEASVVALTPQYYNTTFKAGPVVNGSTLPYDSQIVLDVAITGASLPANAATYGQATGTVVFSDNGNVIGTVAVSSTGTAELPGYTLAIGKHSITAAYSGDASYKPGSAGAFTFNVTTQSIYLDIFTDPACPGGSSGNVFYINCLTGETSVNTVLLFSAGALTGAVPTGTITYQLGSGAPVTSPVAAADLSFFGFDFPGSAAVITLPNMPAGAQTLTVTYNGDANYTTTTSTTLFTETSSPLAASSTLLALTSPANTANMTPATPITLTATVTGANGLAPTGTVTLYGVSADELTNPKTLVPGTNGTSSVTVQARAGQFIPGQNFLTATYSGDSKYQPSTSSVLTSVVNSQADFSVQVQNATLVVASGASGTSTIALQSEQGFNATVALTCTAPTSFTCTLSSGAVALNGTATATLTVNAFTTTTAENHPQGVAPFVRDLGAPALACFLLFLLPRRKRYGRVLFALLFGAALAGGIGCGHSSSSQPAPVVVTKTTKAAPGTYNVVVTGTAPSGTVHNTTLTVIVQ